MASETSTPFIRKVITFSETFNRFVLIFNQPELGYAPLISSFRESWGRKYLIFPASRVEVGKEKEIEMHVELFNQLPQTEMSKFSSNGRLILSPIM